MVFQGKLLYVCIMAEFLKCNVSSAALRKQPGHGAELHTQLLRNDRVHVLEEKGNWIRIREWNDSSEGWTLRSQFERCYAQPSPPIGIQPSGPSEASYIFSEEAGSSDTAGIEFPSPTEAFIRQHLHSFLDVPYLWGGFTRNGIDCSGLSRQVYRFLGISLPPVAALQFDKNRMIDFLAEARCGDLAFFINDYQEIDHVGIIIQEHQIIHATEAEGRVVVQTFDQEGIINQSGIRTHRLLGVCRMLPSR